MPKNIKLIQRLNGSKVNGKETKLTARCNDSVIYDTGQKLS